MKNQRGISSLIIVIIIGLIAIGGVLVYQYYSSIPDEEVEKKTEEPIDETADWKVYKSEELEVEFKYPKNYIMMDLLGSTEGAILLGDKEFPKPDIEPWYHAPISISFYTSRAYPYHPEQEKTTYDIININGLSVSVLDGKSSPYYGSPNSFRLRIITISRTDHETIPQIEIVVQERYADQISNWNQLEKVVSGILSTFKFIK